MSEQGEIESSSKHELIPLIYQEIKANWQRYKQSLGIWTFDDMLDLAEQISENSLFINVMRQRFQYVIVDEFQDTDPKQWNIFKKLFVEASSNTKLFIIGDPKQAIYRFKGGDVETYQKAKKELLNHSQPIILNQNFRSVPAVIEAINLLFKDLLENVDVTAGKQNFDDHCSVGMEVWYGDNLNEIKIAQNIAQEIDKLLDERILKEQEQIAILVRTRKQGQIIVKELEDKNIPYSFYKQNTLFQNPEAYEIYSFLQTLVSQQNDYQLCSTNLFNPERNTIVEIYPKIQNYQWAFWRYLARNGKYLELFTDLFKILELESNCILKESLEQLHHYQALSQIMIDWSYQNNSSIENLTLRLKKYIQKDSQITDDQEIEQEGAFSLLEQKVILMTIHASKGLEFSHVFLFGLWKENKDTKDWTIIHDENNARKIYFKNKEQVEKKVTKELNQELLNLIYVACTRAKNMVYFPVLKKLQKGNLPEKYQTLCDKLFNELRQNDCFKFVEIDQHCESLVKKGHLPDPSYIPFSQKENISISLKERQNPLLIKSYSSLSHTEMTSMKFSEESHIKQNVDAMEYDFTVSNLQTEFDEELPKGVNTGNFLHEALEIVDIQKLKKCYMKSKKQNWQESENQEFVQLRKKYGIDEKFQEQYLNMIWNAWTQEFVIESNKKLKPLCQASQYIREPRFFFQYQENKILNGAIDLVFQYEEKIYFVDWKSNWLDDYSQENLQKVVKKKYSLQIAIYAQAVKRWLRIQSEQDFKDRFGGCLYIFLRSIHKNTGLYFYCPRWQELCDFEQHYLF